MPPPPDPESGAPPAAGASAHPLRTPGGKRRARGLGVPLEGRPGPHNAITDVAGVEVGYTTLIEGTGRLVAGSGPVRTGVTALLPRGKGGADVPAFAGVFSLNGNGELTGSHWVEESGQLEGPITLTNTFSCGIARDATVRWQAGRYPHLVHAWGLPVAGETWDGELNDIAGFHLRTEHVLQAIDGATGGPLELGSLGGGTGMICYGFKGGNGSASRRVHVEGAGDYVLGVFVQANFGSRNEFVIAGVPVGIHIPSGAEARPRPGGSVIAVVATDAPLLPHQCKRLARRVSLGLARTGSVSHDGSGDIFIAFSTANQDAWNIPDSSPATAAYLPNERIDPLFSAVVQATEEAVIDALVANETMTGRDGITVHALPHEQLVDLLRRYGRLMA